MLPSTCIKLLGLGGLEIEYSKQLGIHFSSLHQSFSKHASFASLPSAGANPLSHAF